MPRTTLLLNTHTFAASQFFNHSANSATVFQGKLLFATSQGLFESGGNLDGTAPIAAHVKLPISHYGYQGQKSPRSMLLGGRFDGKMQVAITDENGVEQQYTTPKLGNEDGTKLALRSDQRSRYLQTVIGNVDGADFSLESAEIVFIPGPEPRR